MKSVLLAAFVCCSVASLQVVALAQDSIWDNGDSNFEWDFSSQNWSGLTWTDGLGAIFGSTGAGTINVGVPVQVNSLNFTANGYSLVGSGPITFVDGTSTLTTGVANVAAGVTATINAPIVSGVGFQKYGEGTLELGGTGNSLANVVALYPSLDFRVGLMVGRVGSIPLAEPSPGRVTLLSNSVLPSSTNVGISNGYLDIGSNNVTVNNLYFTNQNQSKPWDSVLNANNGVIGSGTLRVLGEIHVIGQSGLNLGNSIASDVDLGGGTQVVRVGVISSFASNRGLMFTGSLSNGSLKKAIGLAANGTIGSIDGISLFGNNTYTGDTILNSGTNVITGTNATQSLTIAGIAGPGGSRAILQGANGSLGAATGIRAYAAGQFIIDNNATEGASGNNSPFIAAAQNNDRIADSSTIELRDGSFIYRGFSGSAASETFGRLNIAGGHNDVLVAPNGGTVVLSANDLVMAPRSSLNIGTAGATGTAELGNQAKVLFSGAVPAADSTGIIRGVVTGSSTAGIASSTTPSNLVTYDPVDGFKAFSGYQADFLTSGANVALTSSTSTTTQTINALKTTGTMTTSIDSGETLRIDSGMMISASGTHTVSGGTLDFGSSPGMIFGNTTINSAMTGTDGLVHSTGSVTLAGDMSGLSGTLNVNGGFATQLSLNTGTFAGPIQVRNGTISFGANQVGPGLGAITLGVPENASDLFHATPTIGFTTAVNQIDRDIIVDNGGTNLDGILPSDSLVARIAPSNYNLDRHFSGDVTLHSDLAIFGGSATGATNTSSIFFDGDISGTGRILFRNGRVVFGAGSTWSNSGGMVIGALGNAAQVSFFGTGTGNGDISYFGSTTALPGLFRYSNDNSFGGGSISIFGGLTSGTTIEPTASSVISNQINLNNVLPNVSINTIAGVTAEWAGQMNGAGSISKNGAGTWVISGNSNTHTGAISVSDGTLLVEGTIAMSSNTLAVGSNGILGGSGVINRNVSIAGSLAPGSSPGILTVNGYLSMNSGSTWYAQLGGLASGQFDQVVVSGNLDVLSNLVVSLVDGHTLSLNESYLIAAVDGDLNGQFSGLSEGSLVGNFGGINLFVSYTGVTGNGIRLYTVPEPGSIMAALALVALPFARRRKPA